MNNALDTYRRAMLTVYYSPDQPQPIKIGLSYRGGVGGRGAPLSRTGRVETIKGPANRGL